jgi:hypothetical protein
MGRIRGSLRAACLTAGLAVASAALAQDAWSVHRYDRFRFSIETPRPPTVTDLQVPTQAAPATGMLAEVDINGGASALVFASVDFTGYSMPEADKLLEITVGGTLKPEDFKLDSETNITVEGAPGRDVEAHNATKVMRERILLKNQRLYELLGIAPTASGVPVQYVRFMHSLKLD